MNELQEATAKVCSRLQINDLKERADAKFYVADELYNAGYSLRSIRDTMNMSMACRQLLINIHKLEPIKKEVEIIKPRDYKMEAQLFLSGMWMMSLREKKESMGFIVECLKWGK